jgi:hypothetical protein
MLENRQQPSSRDALACRSVWRDQKIPNSEFGFSDHELIEAHRHEPQGAVVLRSVARLTRVSRQFLDGASERPRIATADKMRPQDVSPGFI